MNDYYKIPMEDYYVTGRPDILNIEDISYDEYNPRISMFRDSETMSEGCDKLSQVSIEFALKAQRSYWELKKNILENGGAMVPIWVIKEGNKYIAIEGNTRLFIYREIYSEEQDKRFLKINAIVLDLDEKQVNEEVKDFIRLTCHLKGHTDWDRYEQAKYLFELYNKDKYPIRILSKRTKLSVNEIKQDIDAYKLMANQFFPKYGEDDSRNIHKFSYFKEYVKNKNLRSAMDQKGFSDSDFCDWVGQNKFERATDIRRLKEIISNNNACEKFLQKDVERALEILKEFVPQKSDKLYMLISDVIKRIDGLSFEEITSLKESKNSKKSKLLSLLGEKLDNLIDSIK